MVRACRYERGREAETRRIWGSCMPGVIVCQPRLLPRRLLQESAEHATEVNPVNYPPIERLARVMPGFRPTRQRAAILISKYWGREGVRLTVVFLDNPPADMRSRILSHMNAWGESSNVRFTAARTDFGPAAVSTGRTDRRKEHNEAYC